MKISIANDLIKVIKTRDKIQAHNKIDSSTRTKSWFGLGFLRLLRRGHKIQPHIAPVITARANFQLFFSFLAFLAFFRGKIQLHKLLVLDSESSITFQISYQSRDWHQPQHKHKLRNKKSLGANQLHIAICKRIMCYKHQINKLLGCNYM